MGAAETVFVRGQGGSIFERDVPAEGSLQREIFDEALAKGDLHLVPAADWVSRDDGSKYLVETPASDDDIPAEKPTSKWTKAELINWLTVNEVDHDPKATNAELAGVVDGAREWFDAVEALEAQS